MDSNREREWLRAGPIAGELADCGQACSPLNMHSRQEPKAVYSEFIRCNCCEFVVSTMAIDFSIVIRYLA